MNVIDRHYDVEGLSIVQVDHDRTVATNRRILDTKRNCIQRSFEKHRVIMLMLRNTQHMRIPDPRIMLKGTHRMSNSM